jgi:hypothetical protein
MDLFTASLGAFCVLGSLAVSYACVVVTRRVQYYIHHFRQEMPKIWLKAERIVHMDIDDIPRHHHDPHHDPLENHGNQDREIDSNNRGKDMISAFVAGKLEAMAREQCTTDSDMHNWTHKVVSMSHESDFQVPMLVAAIPDTHRLAMLTRLTRTECGREMKDNMALSHMFEEAFIAARVDEIDSALEIVTKSGKANVSFPDNTAFIKERGMTPNAYFALMKAPAKPFLVTLEMECARLRNLINGKKMFMQQPEEDENDLTEAAARVVLAEVPASAWQGLAAIRGPLNLSLRVELLFNLQRLSRLADFPLAECLPLPNFAKVGDCLYCLDPASANGLWMVCDRGTDAHGMCIVCANKAVPKNFRGECPQCTLPTLTPAWVK